jgi:hypothetical protein
VVYGCRRVPVVADVVVSVVVNSHHASALITSWQSRPRHVTAGDRPPE